MCKRSGTALIGNLFDVPLPTLGDCAVCFMWLSGSLCVAGRRRRDERILFLGLNHQPAQCVSEERNKVRLVCALHYSFQRHLVGFHGDVLIHPAGPQRTNERTPWLGCPQIVKYGTAASVRPRISPLLADASSFSSMSSSQTSQPQNIFSH